MASVYEKFIGVFNEKYPPRKGESLYDVMQRRQLLNDLWKKYAETYGTGVIGYFNMALRLEKLVNSFMLRKKALQAGLVIPQDAEEVVYEKGKILYIKTGNDGKRYIYTPKQAQRQDGDVTTATTDIMGETHTVNGGELPEVPVVGKKPEQTNNSALPTVTTTSSNNQVAQTQPASTVQNEQVVQTATPATKQTFDQWMAENGYGNMSRAERRAWRAQQLREKGYANNIELWRAMKRGDFNKTEEVKPLRRVPAEGVAKTSLNYDLDKDERWGYNEKFGTIVPVKREHLSELTYYKNGGEMKDITKDLAQKIDALIMKCGGKTKKASKGVKVRKCNDGKQLLAKDENGRTITKKCKC